MGLATKEHKERKEGKDRNGNDGGIRAIHVETGRDNTPALAVYRRAGFWTDQVHLTLGLAEPTHAP
jgi:hypothetical protein